MLICGFLFMIIRLLKTIVPFLAAFAVSVFLMRAFDSPSLRIRYLQTESRPVAKSTWSGRGQGSSGPGERGSGSRADEVTPTPRGPNSPLRILSKPQARYTDEARANNVQGAVRLKVVMRASGQVGEITVVEGLPDGLTEQAVDAARKLKFEPARKSGLPVSKVITIDYNFTIY